MFKKKTVRYGIPFLLFILGGSFGLKEFQSLRFRYKPSTEEDIRETAHKMKIKMKDASETTLESEFAKMKDKNLNNWENKRIPRPWEESPSNV